jgi:L-rhamnose-H+ transport protein
LITTGILLAIVSGIANGLFPVPMKRITGWQWENIWLVFIVISCLLMPAAAALSLGVDLPLVLRLSPGSATRAALAYGFAWGFGAILFGLSVDRLGVSLPNSIGIGLSSALGSLIPLLVRGGLRLGPQQLALLAGVVCFLLGVALCGTAGRLRDRFTARASSTGLLFAIGAGILSGVFNVGFTLALPITQAAEGLRYAPFAATLPIWILMLGAGSIPNIAFCGTLLVRNRGFRGYLEPRPRAWLLSLAMALLWGGSIFLYGLAAGRLGDLGPAIGWPLSMTAALLTATGMGILLGEWRNASPEAIRRMRGGVILLVVALLLCAAAAGLQLQPGGPVG